MVAAVVAATFIDSRLLPLAVAVGLAFWPLRWQVTGRFTRRTPVDWGIAGLLLMLPVSLWVTAYPQETRLQAMRLLSGILLFYSLVNWANSPTRLLWV
ncbi:MAG TPA: hypothetical protein VN363_07665, partial [Anaerolineales bacterium]|nr:hypothetical protein [Anaerolineales bacterium]